MDLLKRVLERCNDSPAIIVNDSATSHRELARLTQSYHASLVSAGLKPGTVVSFDGDYSASAVALLLALVELDAIVVPLSSDSKAQFEKFRTIAETELLVSIENGNPVLTVTGRSSGHPHYEELRSRGAAGLVLFSSGSTGEPKAIVQDMDRLAGKFERPGKAQRMLIFLQLDHIGGINSLLYTVANGGTLVVPDARSPDAVGRAIALHDVELLPTSPTFLNLVLLSGAIERHDLSSLRLITYGTEPMPESTLERISRAVPGARLQQTYGLSELGILRSRSRDSNSLWMQVGGDEFETKIVDGRLWVRAESAMVGYLNADAPFDEDGFFDTGDRVEQDGDWIRVLGRDSDIINVGGEKVYPAEVESVLLEMPNVRDVVVFGEANPITGRHVVAKVQLDSDEAASEFKARMRRFCRGRVAPFKIPARVSVTEDATHNARFKRMRRD